MAADNAKQGKNDHLAFYMDLVGHDILNNNQAVLGYLELILANPSSDRTVRNYAEKAFSHVRTSTLLVENEKRLMATMMLDRESLRPTDIRAKLERSQTELARFFPDKRIRVRLEQIPKDARALGNSAAEELIVNAMVSAVRLDPGEDVELRVSVAQSVFRGSACWTVTIEEPNALLPPSLKGRDIKSVYLLDSSVAVKLSGLLFSKMIAETLGGDFDAYELPGAKDHVGAGFTITLRRADEK